MLNWLRNLIRRPSGVRAQRRGWRVIRARYDAAVTNDDNRRHWANADALSAGNARSAADAPQPCRYEVANNSYARGSC